MLKWLVLVSALAAASAATHYQQAEGDNGIFKRSPHILDDDSLNIAAEVFDSPDEGPNKRSIKSMDSSSSSESDSSSLEDDGNYRRPEVSETDNFIFKRSAAQPKYLMKVGITYRKRREAAGYEPRVQKKDQGYNVPQLERKRREAGGYEPKVQKKDEVYIAPLERKRREGVEYQLKEREFGDIQRKRREAGKPQVQVEGEGHSVPKLEKKKRDAEVYSPSLEGKRREIGEYHLQGMEDGAIKEEEEERKKGAPEPFYRRYKGE